MEIEVRSNGLADRRVLPWVILDPGRALTVVTRALFARGGQAPFAWRVTGPPLPLGLTFDFDTAQGETRLVFAGVPERVATVSLLVGLSDVDGRFVQYPYTIDVRASAASSESENQMGCMCARPPRRPSGRRVIGLGVVLVGVAYRIARRTARRPLS